MRVIAKRVETLGAVPITDRRKVNKNEARWGKGAVA